MLHSVLNVKIRSNEEMRSYAEKDMFVLTNLYRELKSSELQKKINYILEKKNRDWIEQIQNLLNREENRMIKGLSDELLVLSRLCEIHEKEKGIRQQTSLEKFSSLEIMRQVYQETVFYLRRMEMDMEDEVCEEFFILIDQWELSIEYIRMVLKNGAIHKKKHTLEKLEKLLKKNGYTEYSEMILKDLDERYDS